MPKLSSARRQLIRQRDEEIIRMYTDPTKAPTYRDIAAELSKRENPIYHITWHTVAQTVRKWQEANNQSSVLTN